MSEHIEINADLLRAHCCGPVKLRDGSRGWLVGQMACGKWALSKGDNGSRYTVGSDGCAFSGSRQACDIVGPWVEPVIPECPGWTPPAGLFLTPSTMTGHSRLHKHQPRTGGRGWDSVGYKVLRYDTFPVIWPEGTDWEDCCCSADLVRKAQGVGG